MAWLGWLPLLLIDSSVGSSPRITADSSTLLQRKGHVSWRSKANQLKMSWGVPSDLCMSGESPSDPIFCCCCFRMGYYTLKVLNSVEMKRQLGWWNENTLARRREEGCAVQSLSSPTLLVDSCLVKLFWPGRAWIRTRGGLLERTILDFHIDRGEIHVDNMPWRRKCQHLKLKKTTNEN
jgi:hypothetical protein